MKTTAFALLFIFVFQLPGLTQKKQEDILFSEDIHGDSIKIYFTHDFALTGKECHEIVRYTRVSADGNFYGAFSDYTKSGELLGRGSYKNGQMSGLFETFYPGEVLKTRGTFQENNPVGEWLFFYETGALNRQLRIEDDTLIVTMVSEKGDTLVKNGEGRFEGQVRNISGPIYAKGEVKNFRRSGKWTGYVREFEKDYPYNREVFSNGKLQKGTFPNAKAGFQNYCCGTYLSPMLAEYYVTPGALTSCHNYRSRTSKGTSAKVKSNLTSFKLKLDALVRSNRFRNDLWGNNHISIQFTVTAEGKADDFNVVSKHSADIAGLIQPLIRERVTWEPGTQDGNKVSRTMYFNLYLNVTDTGFSYSFNFAPFNRPL